MGGVSRAQFDVLLQRLERQEASGEGSSQQMSVLTQTVEELKEEWLARSRRKEEKAARETRARQDAEAREAELKEKLEEERRQREEEWVTKTNLRDQETAAREAQLKQEAEAREAELKEKLEDERRQREEEAALRVAELTQETEAQLKKELEEERRKRELESAIREAQLKEAAADRETQLKLELEATQRQLEQIRLADEDEEREWELVWDLQLAKTTTVQAPRTSSFATDTTGINVIQPRFIFENMEEGEVAPNLQFSMKLKRMTILKSSIISAGLLIVGGGHGGNKDRAEKSEVRRISATGSEGRRLLHLPKWGLDCSYWHSGCQLGEDRVALSCLRSLLLLRKNVDGSLALEKELRLGASFAFHESVCHQGCVVLCGNWDCELHRCSGASWRREELPGMTTPRSDFASVLVGDQLFAIGGYGGGKRLSSIQTLSLTEPRNWQTSAAQLPTPESLLKATVVNGRIIVVGGWNGTH